MLLHLFGIRRRPTLPGRVQPSTIGAEGLNFCVRYGNRWNPFAIATGNCIHFAWPALRLPMLVVHPLRAEPASQTSRFVPQGAEVGGFRCFCFLPLIILAQGTVSSSRSLPLRRGSFRPVPCLRAAHPFRPHLCVKFNACYASLCFCTFRARCRTLTTAQVKDDCVFLTFPCSIRPSSQSR